MALSAIAQKRTADSASHRVAAESANWPEEHRARQQLLKRAFAFKRWRLQICCRRNIFNIAYLARLFLLLM
jgi:hypothetical protein